MCVCIKVLVCLVNVWSLIRAMLLRSIYKHNAFVCFLDETKEEKPEKMDTTPAPDEKKGSTWLHSSMSTMPLAMQTCI